MKSLVVFFTRTGNTKRVAEELATKLKADIEELSDLKNRSGIVGWLRAGKGGASGKSTEIKAVKSDVLKYDLVLLGTPVWAGNVCPAVRAFIEQNKSEMKKVAFFSSQKSAEEQRVFGEMEKVCGKKPVGKLIVHSSELSSGILSEKVAKFASELA